MTNPDTLQILDSIREELARAKAEYKRKPDYALSKEIKWMESKVAQYTERAKKRLQS